MKLIRVYGSAMLALGTAVVVYNAYRPSKETNKIEKLGLAVSGVGVGIILVSFLKIKK